MRATSWYLLGALLAVAGVAFVVVGMPDGGEAGALTRHATKPKPKPITLAWGGDVTLGSSYGNPPGGGWPLLAPLSKTLHRADLAAVNYEGTFGSGGASKCGAVKTDCYAFQAPPGNARSLQRAGVDIVNQANNHAFDFGPQGHAQTLAALSAAGVKATGAPGQIQILRSHGNTVAFVGFSTYPWAAPLTDDAAVAALIKQAAKQANIVVAFLHGGAEGANQAHLPHGPETAFGENRGDLRHFAHTAVDAGADLVLGSGPHVLRGLELFRGRLIAYSLGNLAGYHNFSNGGLSGLSAILTVALSPSGRFFAARITSLTLDGAAAPHPDPGRRAVALISNLTREDFVRGGGLRIDRRGLVTGSGRR